MGSRMDSKQSPSDENPNHEDHLAGDLVGDGVAPIETKTHADSSDRYPMSEMLRQPRF